MGEGYYLQKVVPTVAGGSEWTCLEWSFPKEVVRFNVFQKEIFTIQEAAGNLMSQIYPTTVFRWKTLFRREVSASMVGRVERTGLGRIGRAGRGRGRGSQNSTGCLSEVHNSPAPYNIYETLNSCSSCKPYD